MLKQNGLGKAALLAVLGDSVVGIVNIQRIFLDLATTILVLTVIGNCVAAILAIVSEAIVAHDGHTCGDMLLLLVVDDNSSMRLMSIVGGTSALRVQRLLEFGQQLLRVVAAVDF